MTKQQYRYISQIYDKPPEVENKCGSCAVSFLLAFTSHRWGLFYLVTVLSFGASKNGDFPIMDKDTNM